MFKVSILAGTRLVSGTRCVISLKPGRGLLMNSGRLVAGE